MTPATAAATAAAIDRDGRPVSTPATEARLLTAFRRAASGSPAYATLLAEHGVGPDQVRDVASFVRLCPLLGKHNTFDRFALEQLCIGGELADLADVLTSSGHGGRFSFGVSTRAQAAATTDALDDALDAAFGIRSRSTLAINCLPMGVVFSSNRMTVATTSVREDMAVALVQTFGHRYDQILIVGDPLFMKRFMDHAREQSVDWTRYRVNVVIGEEIFGERFRDYLAGGFGMDRCRPEAGYIMSSFGVGELGLHLLYETPATIALRRAALANPEFGAELFGAGLQEGAVLPMLFTCNPLRTFLEIVGVDASGYGRLTMSMLDTEQTVPLLRYQTGDVAALPAAERVASLVRQYGIAVPDDMPQALIALRGRAREALPNGSHVGVYKDAIYADREVADRLTGAVRMEFDGHGCTMHVQLTPSGAGDAELERRVMAAVPPAARPERVVLWRYGHFPFGMTLDYQRKFTYYLPPDAASGSV